MAGDAIAGFDLWHLRLPVVSRRDHGIGAVAEAIEVIVLRLTAESGAQGFGEAAPWVVFTGSPEASFAALDRYIRPLVLGRNIAERAAVMDQARHAVAHCTEAKAALETAWLDLEAKLAGKPVWALLGDKAQPRIPLSCSIANPDFDADIELMRRLTDDGIGIVKLKTGFAGHDFDVMRLERIRAEFPRFRVRVDYNQGLDPDAALACLRDIAVFAPDFIEQPVAAHRFDLLARLRETIDVPLLADESVFGPEDMARAVREDICDGVSVKIMKAGGLARARETAARAGAAGLSAYGGDMFETGLAHLAGAHMIAATPQIGLGCEFYQARYFLADDILAAPFPIKDGHVVVPDAPGLGIDPDPEKLERHAIRKS